MNIIDLPKVNPMEDESNLRIYNINFIKVSKNVTKSERLIFDIMVMYMIPTWNSYCGTTRELATISGNCIEQVRDSILSLKKKDYIAECTDIKKGKTVHYYYINPKLVKYSKEVFNFVIELFTKYNFKERESIKRTYMKVTLE